ncbi:CmpA/NrtA family ABC transporter substrate-binding protein [Desulfotalea psychrophila]|uniref:Uncharacterized protein n=1 Tax=Desulfotalea psychrophila (strain LSv54 / DSM 12343) TaxID=177439 RepID=Q6ANI0_DESPS|nr:CmpA/NrtA family ABC transporter substrate-binding protein [Desulfotalea psychrophila]CAG36094.1 hypothetical protein DP1365 [Desulfotalea psychrophila LSv54]
MHRNLKRKIQAVIIAMVVTLAMGNVYAAKAPNIYMGYILTTHHSPLMVAADRGKELNPTGPYLASMVAKQKYRLIAADGKTLAVINLIVSKNGSETSTLFAMNRLDLGLASSTAFMSGIDKGTKVKIICPLHVDGMSMVFPMESKINSYQDLATAIKASKTPYKIGYHSPTSAPRVVFEGALHRAGFKISENPNDVEADILMVDLKSTANLIPALLSKQVDSWVGPAPHPVVAEYKKVGHIGLDSRDLPPLGAWTDFPCCVMGASEQAIKEQPEIVQAMADIMTAATAWSNNNKKETAKISSRWIGVPAAAIEKSTIIYTTTPSQNWLKGEGIFLTMLNGMHKFKGKLKDMDLAKAAPLLYDFSFNKKALDQE